MSVPSGSSLGPRSCPSTDFPPPQVRRRSLFGSPSGGSTAEVARRRFAEPASLLSGAAAPDSAAASFRGRSALVAPPKPPYREKSEKLLEAIDQAKATSTRDPRGDFAPALSVPGLESYTIIREFGRTGQFGRAFLVRNPDQTLRVLKFLVPAAEKDVQLVPGQVNHGYKTSKHLILILAHELADYYQCRTTAFPVAIHADLEVFMTGELRRELDKIMAVKDEKGRVVDEDDRIDALKEFVAQHLTQGYHEVEYVPNASPSKQGDISADPFWTHVRERFRILWQTPDALFRSDFSLSNVGTNQAGELRYFDLSPVEPSSVRVNLNPMLKTFATQGSAMWRFLDPRPAQDE